MNTEKNKLESQKENFAEKKVNKISSNLPVIRPLCPTCGRDSLITLSGITYCMVDCCDGVKGHNVL